MNKEVVVRMSLTDSETKYLKRMGYGAILGTSAVLVSGLTQELVKINLGFPSINFKNIIKVAGVTAGIINLINCLGLQIF